MYIGDLLLKRIAVATVNSDQTVTEALAKINDSGYRSVPVVGADDTYKGMIYKVDLLEYLLEQNGDGNASIGPLIKHQDIYLDENVSFLNALLEIKALPFISIVKDGKLTGILTHNQVESVLEDAFGLKTGGINMTVASSEAAGTLERLTKTLRGEHIEGLFTLDNGSVLARRVVVTLRGDKTNEEIDKLKNKLEKNGFRTLQTNRIEKKW
ncbi:CBS domain-containing protein [Sporosarcina jiandibaonis]|uniref:CBS domain-containing protein n=1 Tax=Sporosarcina jiandibaonis TaxID=2715535 RepID=UPI001555FBB1|nr:CBS domain-containing protein [Sporosarcina jiandibaonis]